VTPLFDLTVVLGGSVLNLLYPPPGTTSDNTTTPSCRSDDRQRKRCCAAHPTEISTCVPAMVFSKSRPIDAMHSSYPQTESLRSVPHGTLIATRPGHHDHPHLMSIAHGPRCFRGRYFVDDSPGDVQKWPAMSVTTILSTGRSVRNVFILHVQSERSPARRR